MKISKFKRKVIIILSIALLLLIMAGVIISSLFLSKTNKKEIQSVLSAEMKRSMTYADVQPGESATSSQYVTFDVFSLKDTNGDGIAEAKRGTCNEIGKQDTMYFELRVNDNGYLKDGVITIDSKNFYLNTAIVKDSVVKNNYISNNTKVIEFNNIQNGSQRLFTGIIRSGDYSDKTKIFDALKQNKNNYSKVNSVTLTGIHVSDDNVETPISKTVNFDVDWYGETTASIDVSNIKNLIRKQDLQEDEDINLEFTVTTSENSNELLLSSADIEGIIPDLNGFKPKSLFFENSDITYNFDSNTGVFNASNTATVDSRGLITKQCYDTTYYDYHNVDKSKRYNEWKITVTYPRQALEMGDSFTSVQLIIPMKVTYTGFNNNNSEFENPYISDIARTSLASVWIFENSGETLDFGTYIGKKVYSPYERRTISKAKPLKILNEISDSEDDDFYEVRWFVHSGIIDEENNGVELAENIKNEHTKADRFIKADGTVVSMENYTTNAGIYFEGISDLLGEDGWIKIYNDDTNTEIVTLTSSNWNEEYWYENPVKHIRIKTSKINEHSALTIVNIKELNDLAITNDFGMAGFEELEHIDTNLTAYGIDNNTNKITSATADYEQPYSIALISADKAQVSTQQTDENPENIVLKISTESYNYNEQKWKNGTFLIKMPEDVIEVREITSITVDNPDVEIANYELYEENGNYFIKIDTENDEETTFNILVDVSIVPNPRLQTKTEIIELYAKNEQGSSYLKSYSAKDIYDLDLNGNVEERVSRNVLYISFVSPNSLLTSQQTRKGDEEVTIAPRVAKIDKEQRKATIDVNITNNYTSDITDVVIQGVIPFRGNKYILTDGDLGSQYDTTMSDGGISIDVVGDTTKDISTYTTIYYSTKEKPTNNLTDPTNNWVQANQVTDWSEIKSYAISLGNYKLSREESHTFSYEINIPDGLEYNDISYSEHGIYFALMTDAGKYYTSTAVNKLGFMIAKQYDLEIEKYQKNTTKKLPNISFKITEEGANSGTVRTTDENGKLELSGLFAEKKYKIIEYKTTDDYCLNEEEIEIYTYTDENDNLHVAYKNDDGTYIPLEEKYSWIKSASAIAQRGTDYKIQLVVEDDVKAKLKLTKKGGEEFLKNVKFSLSGKGIDNLILQTDENGVLSTSGLFVDEEYSVTEIRADGYYINDGKIRFKIVSSGTNEFNLQILENNEIISSSDLTMQDSIPTVNLVVEDEKIPTYNFEVVKYAEQEEGEEPITLQGAQFLLQGDGLSDNGIILTTDENGKINVDGLYEYVEKNGNPKGNISAIYTLKEIYAPNGYALDQTEIKFRATRNQSGTLEVEIISGSDRIRQVTENETTKKDINIENANTQNAKVSIGVEDPPIFEILKVDENNNPVEGVKFEIYSIDDAGNSTKAKDLNGDEIGVCTTNSAGKISLNLPEGLYKAVEVETLERFEFDVNEANRTKFFGIGTSKPAESEYGLEWTSSIAKEGWESINSVYPTTDGGVIAAGSFYDQAIINDNEEIQIQSEGYRDGLVIKYSQNGTIEWYKNIGGSDDEDIIEIIQTSDGGYALIGNTQSHGMNIDSSININGVQDGIIIKLDSSGEYEWSKVIGGELDDYIYSINEDSNGNLIITGGYCSSQLLLPNGNSNITISNLGKIDGFVASYSSNGNTLNWYQKITGTNIVRAVDSIQVPSGYVVAVNYIGTINLEKTDVQTQANYESGTEDIVLIWYNSNGTYNKKLRIGGTGNDKISGLINYDGGILAYGEFVGEIDANDNGTNDFSSNGDMDNFLFKYSTNGDFERSNSMTFGGTLDEGLGQVTESGDNLILGGWTYSEGFDIDNNGENEITKSLNNSDSYIIKLDKTSNGYMVDKFYKQAGSNDEEGRTVCTTTDGGLIIAGATSSENFTIESAQDKTITGKGYSDGFVAKYNDILISPEFAKQQQLKFVNEFKKYKITTQLYSVDAQNNYNYDIGGTITGEYGTFETTNYPTNNHIKYVETVKYQEDANNNIVIVPEDRYVITKITINGEKYNFIPDDEGKVTIPAFENIDSNKHIVVELVSDYSQIMVKHLLWTKEDGTTETEVADGYTQTRAIGSQYSTSPIMDLEDYEIITNKDYYGDKTEQQICEILEINSLADINYNSFEEFQNDYYIPQNASGTYKEEPQTIKYYYKEKTYSLQVEHLIYGTNEKVPDIDGNEVETLYTDGYKKYIDDEKTPESKYETTRSDRVDYTIYELVTDSGNTSGTITKDTFVKYYYQKKDAANLIVHHYIVGTENKVPSNTGEFVEDQIYPLDSNETAKIGDEYVTQNAEEKIAQNYRVATNQDVYGDQLPDELTGKENDIYVPENYRGNYTDQVQEVTYYYALVTPEISNNITKTTNKELIITSEEDNQIQYNISYTAVIQKYSGDCTITIIDSLPYEIDTTKNYELDGGEYDNTTKTITWKELVKDVDTYSDANSGNISINKKVVLTYKDISDEEKTIKNIVQASALLIATNTESEEVFDEVEHSFEQKTIISVTKVWEDNDNALGIRPDSVRVRLKATVLNEEAEEVEYEIPRNIPKEVELKNSTGDENGDNWTYKWEGIDKYDDHGNKINYAVEELPLEGNLGIVYKSEVTKDANNSYELFITNTYEKPTEKTFYTVEKIWDDNNNENGRRPDLLRITIHEGDNQEVIAQHELDTNSETSYSFELPKYDELGNEIQYSAQEVEVNENDLLFYVQTNKEVQANKTIFTNTFAVPNIRTSVSVSKVWDDNNNEKGKRPNSIKLVLKEVENERETTIEEYILKVSENENEHIFDDLTKYDQNGNEIKYLIDEEEVNSGDLKFYSKKYEKTGENEYTITNELTDDEKINIEAIKKWNDNNNTNGKRPKSVIIHLMNGTSVVDSKVVSESSNWKTVFENINKYDSNKRQINYSIKEEEVNQNDLYFYTSSGGNVVNTDNNYRATITNTFTVPKDTKEIKVIKNWNDNNNQRLDKIKLVLTGNGKRYEHQLTKANEDKNNTNNWEYTFKDLPKYNEKGEEIQYVLSEEENNPGELKRYIQSTNGYKITNSLIVSDMKIEKNGIDKIYSLTDTINYKIDYEVSINKDYKNKVTIRLEDKLPYKIDLEQKHDLKGGQYSEENQTITWVGNYNQNTNTITWSNGEVEKINLEDNKIKVSKEISFIYKGISIEDNNKTITNIAKGKLELENGYSKEVQDDTNTEIDFNCSITITKVWKGKNINPSPISVKFKYGKESKNILLDYTNSWTYDLGKLDKYDQEGKIIEYSVVEENIPTGFYAKIEKKIPNPEEPNKISFIITNYKFGSISVTKVDKNDESKKLKGAEFTLIKLKEENGKWVEDKSFKALKGITSDTGIIIFSNLEYGKYRLQETNAPEGYKTQDDSIDIELNENNQDYTLKIPNKKNIELPLTGGKGAISVILLGIGFIIVGVIMKKRFK